MLFRIAMGLVISAIVPATLLAQVRDNGVRRVPQHQPVLQQQSGVQINLKPGFSVLIRLNDDAGTVVVGSPEIADASIQSPRNVVVTANKPGITNIIVLDTQNRDQYAATVVVGHQIQGNQVRIHTKPSVHDFFAYQCTDVECQRVEHRFDTVAVQPNPIFVLPPNASVTQEGSQTRVTTPPAGPPQRGDTRR